LKRQGTIVEQKFVTRALEKGLDVSTPVGDYKPYDFIVQSGDGLLHKIQVKSSEIVRRMCHTNKTYYKIIVAKGCNRKVAYTKSEVDFFACYVDKTWYIIPITAVRGKKALNLYPHRPNVDGIYEGYKNGWDVLRK
tara:strand:+ start:836 stop:1243 length:408 start_codon:yes stop_codon:yes gene_type:complete